MTGYLSACPAGENDSIAQYSIIFFPQTIKVGKLDL